MLINDVYLPYLDNKSRFLVLYGGGGSGKSVFAAQKIIARVKSEKPHRFLCLRKVGATVKDSIFAELKNVIFMDGMENEFRVNKSEYSITHLPTGNEILCKGLDEPEKIKSIQGITGIWAEEVTEFTPEDLDQLNIRVRGEKKNYVQFIFSFNPISEDNHVVKRFVIDKAYEDCTVVKTTYKDNLFLSDQDKAVLEGFKLTNKLFYDVYCLGIPGIVDKSNKFFYSFHDGIIKEGLTEDRSLPLKLSFDFNIDPFTCYVYQTPDRKTAKIFDKIRLNDSDITQITDRIKAKYPNRFYVCTGDVSGKNRTGMVRGKLSYWHTIKQELNLSDAQIRLRGKNLDLIQSRVLCNSCVQNLDIQIDATLTELINDMKFAKVDDYGILIKDRKDNKNDDLDCVRYILDAEFPDIIVNHKKYK